MTAPGALTASQADGLRGPAVTYPPRAGLAPQQHPGELVAGIEQLAGGRGQVRVGG